MYFVGKLIAIGGTQWRTLLRHSATSRKVAGSIPDGVIGIFHWHDGKDQLDWSCEEWRCIRVKEQRNILHEIRKRKANWIGHILRRNCLLHRVTEGKIQGGIEVTGRQGRRLRKLLDDLKERRGYFNLKEEALDRTMWRARFGRGFGPVVRQTAKWMNDPSSRTMALGSTQSLTEISTRNISWG